MTTMNVSLPRAQEEFVDDQVKSGSFSTASDDIRDPIPREQRLRAREELERKLLEGLNSGAATEMTPADWKELREGPAQAIWRSRGLVEPHARKTPRAKPDLEECAACLVEHGSSEVALRFLVRAEATFAMLAESPGFGRQRQLARHELEGLRSFRVRDFENHLVFYLPRDFGIEVVRVLHGAPDLEALFDDGR